MSEPFYGSGIPMWSGVSSPGFTWFQPPVPVGSQLMGPGVAGLVPTMPGQMPVLQGGPYSAPTAYSMPAMGLEVPATTTAPALLAAVALKRNQPLGPTNDQEIEDFIYDALELFPGASEVEVQADGGRITLTGRVQHKKLKHDAGELAWATRGVEDVQNDVTIMMRRRVRGASREKEQPAAARKSG
jgi:hypothetical protein